MRPYPFQYQQKAEPPPAALTPPVTMFVHEDRIVLGQKDTLQLATVVPILGGGHFSVS